MYYMYIYTYKCIYVCMCVYIIHSFNESDKKKRAWDVYCFKSVNARKAVMTARLLRKMGSCLGNLHTWPGIWGSYWIQQGLGRERVLVWQTHFPVICFTAQVLSSSPLSTLFPLRPSVEKFLNMGCHQAPHLGQDQNSGNSQKCLTASVAHEVSHLFIV